MSYFWKFFNYIINIRKFSGDFCFSEIHAPGRIKIESPGRIKLNGPVYFGPNFTVMNKGDISIGENTIFGPNVCIIDYNHDFSSDEYIPYSSDNLVKPVNVGSHVWIGFGSIILPGVSVGDGAIIGAGSVVTKSVNSCDIVAGNPASVISKRNPSLFEGMALLPQCQYLKCKK
jgi:acetyltransferase-like isoleucine patch superfamily enzyme